MQSTRVVPSIDRDDKCILDYVYKHMLDVSFGEEIHSCEFFCTALRNDILPQMLATIRLRDRCDIHIKIATEIGLKALGNSVGRLRKDDEMRLCLEASFVMLLISRPDASDNLVKATEDMLKRYPEFSDLGEAEMKVLISFRNVMVVAMQTICPRYNKNRLLTLVTRIVEGRSKRYVTGSGQTDQTSHRVLIYERESGVQPISRPRPHSKRDDHTNLKHKRGSRINALLAQTSDSRGTLLNSKRLVVHDPSAISPKLDTLQGVESEVKSPANIAAFSLSPAQYQVVAVTRQISVESNASVISCPDMDFFMGPFLDWYGEVASSPTLDFFHGTCSSFLHN